MQLDVDIAYVTVDTAKNAKGFAETIVVYRNHTKTVPNMLC